MRRGVFDVLKRGFDNSVANWPLVFVRFGEMVVFAVLTVLTFLAVVVPILVSIGIRIMDVRTPGDLESAMTSLMSAWTVLIWIGLALFVLVGVYVAIHSFVEAGCARVYVDGEHTAGPQLNGARSRYAVFSMERWMSGGREGWWPVFWIYNLAWSAAGLVLLLPLIPVLALMLYFGDAEPRASIVIGCAGLLVTLVLGITIAIVTGMWTTRAITDWAEHRSGARPALAHAWRALKGDLARHLVVTIAVIAVALAGSSVFSTFSMFALFGEALGRNSLPFVTWPLRITGQLLSMIFSGAVTSWYLASYAALSVEDRS